MDEEYDIVLYQISGQFIFWSGGKLLRIFVEFYSF